MDVTAINGGGPDKRRAALDALPPELRDAFDRKTVLQGLAEDDPIYDLVLHVTQVMEAIKGLTPAHFSELTAALKETRDERAKASELLARRVDDLERTYNRLLRSQTRISFGWLALAAGLGFVAYPFIDRLLLAPFGL